MLDDFMGFTITQLENWADSIIDAGLPGDPDEWIDIADSIGLDLSLIDEWQLHLVEKIIEERAR